MTAPGCAVEQAVTAYLQDASPAFRQVARGEWGLGVDDVGGRALDIGLRLSDGLLRVQAWVAPPGKLDPNLLLHRNRLAVVVRYAQSSAGDIHVHGELPHAAVCPAELDRLLGWLIEAAEVARSALPQPRPLPAGTPQAARRRDLSRYLR
jgi:hypothetical protein